MSTKAIALKAAKRLQLAKDGKTPIVCRSIWLRINNHCPDEFQKVVYSDSFKLESMTPAQVKKTIAHLPASVEAIGIFGGEPFTTPQLLRATLESIQRQNFTSLTETTVQTIGYWATDRKKTKNILKELIALGATHFNIYGARIWKLPEGAVPDCQQLLCDVLSEEFGAIAPQTLGKIAEVESLFTRDRITFSNRPSGALLAFNKPAPQPKTHDHNHESLSLNRNGYIFTINMNGDVHIAHRLSEPPIGNIFNQPLADIVRSARRNS